MIIKQSNDLLAENVVCSEIVNDLRCVIQDIEQLKNKDSSFLITGGNGFVAYYLTLALLISNDCFHTHSRVTLLVRNMEHAKQRYGSLLEREDLSIIVQDVCDPIDLDRGFDFIIHAASSADAKHFEEDPINVFNSNVIGTENVINLTRKYPCQSAIFISSFTVYGNNTDSQPYIDENFCGPEPWDLSRSCYVYGKRSAEFLCMIAARKYKVPIKIIRPGFVYGASSKEDSRVYAQIIRSVAEKSPIVLRSSGYINRSMIYVTDLVAGIFQALFSGKNGEAYNVSNEHISIRQFAEYAVQVADSPAVQLVFEKVSDKEQVAPLSVFGAMDSTKLQLECGWKPRIAIRDGIRMSANILCKQ